jgi:hypothetical protein
MTIVVVRSFTPLPSASTCFVVVRPKQHLVIDPMAHCQSTNISPAAVPAFEQD